jgi:pyruvate formate lyase activating enzyme
VLLQEIAERQAFIDGVVISGGEPTLDPDLPSLLRAIKKLGLLVKIDTNGLAPGVLSDLIQEALIDYVALDVKTSPSRYGELHPLPVDLDLLPASVALIKSAGIDYEFRTTCVPGYVEDRDISALGSLLKGGKLWVLQQFVPDNSLDEQLRSRTPHPDANLLHFSERARSFVDEVRIRGIR